MKRVCYFAALLPFIALLSACDNLKTPLPGQFYFDGSKQNLAMGSVLGVTQCFKFTHVDSRIKQQVGSRTCLRYTLGEQYYVKHGSPLPGVPKKGRYAYHASPYIMQQASLVLDQGRWPLNLTLKYNTLKSGSFTGYLDHKYKLAGTFTMTGQSEIESY